ncbi:MAG TPA: transposase [Thermoanaerobaculia bacterium]|nr:transposase [Thermoanaerobaculia bacterium]
MPIWNDTHAYRSRLPHLVKRDRPYFVTFCTQDRQQLEPSERDIVIAFCIRDHDTLCWLDCVVVMPDHVHLILTPLGEVTLAKVLGRIKGASARAVNRLRGQRGRLWQRDSFDRIVRCDENLYAKRDYIFNNPVRKGLVKRWEDYPWIWPKPAG